jgi:hypothetical protein
MANLLRIFCNTCTGCPITCGPVGHPVLFQVILGLILVPKLYFLWVNFYLT